ncbi:hypothetical protein Pan14r_21900 [Crateriforma conspicua]|uniref:Transmembrane protein n=2 Tax=Crateriforma conspicua TaxID=2527996 RepID=A0A5C5Y5B0_9PLAN|nr:hypothetical protein Mal65_36550 [Crateriforma conspicua]TWT69893.1 hypothetical protein Pan14r_21900 [Crateriforma conspicua]
MAIRKMTVTTASAESVTHSDTSSTSSSRSDKPDSSRRRRFRLLASGCLGLALVASTGCTMFNTATQSLCDEGCLNDFMMSHHHRVMAARAWQREKKCFGNHRNLRDIKRGFMDAYKDVAKGGTGCTPTVAPREYWGWRYQSADGHVAVNSWFQGYPIGVKAAEQDGIGNYASIQMANLPTRQTSTPGTVNTIAQKNPEPPKPSVSEMIPVPGGYISQNGDFYDKNGNLAGKGTVVDRAIGEPVESAVQVPAIVAADDQPVEVAPLKADVAPTQAQPPAVSLNLSDQVGATPIQADAYQLDEPSQEEIDAVIDDIFGKPQSPASDDADDTNTFESIPFTFE